MPFKQMIQRISPSKIIKERVIKIKPLLPDNVSEIIISKHPEYDSFKGANLMRNVLGLRTTDVRLTEILEQIAYEHQNDSSNSEPNQDELSQKEN